MATRRTLIRPLLAAVLAAVLALGGLLATGARTPAAAAPTITPDRVFTPFIQDTIRDGRLASPDELLPTLPRDDPFYRPPADLDPYTPHGTLLRARPVQIQYLAVQPAHIRAWQLLFVSTGLDGLARPVSGLLMIPDTAPADGPRSLVGYVEANDSLADGCNPSFQWTGGDQIDPALASAMGPVAQMFSDGHAVMMSDYVNDGEPGPHPFSVSSLSGPSVLDGLTAAMQIEEARLAPDIPIGLFGIAGGGVAAGAAAERAAEYAPHLNIRGTVLQAMVVDPASFERTADGGIGAGFVFANALGYAAGYPEDIDLDAELTPAGMALADVFHRSCQAVYLGTPFVPLGALFVNGRPADNPAFRRAYEENRLGQGIPNAPVLISSCRDDFLVPYRDAENLGNYYRSGGTDVTFEPSGCSLGDVLSDPYKAGTELFGMQTVPWLTEKLR